MEEVQMCYDYDRIVTNLSGFACLLISPIQNFNDIVDGQCASYDSRVGENPIWVCDFSLGSWIPNTYHLSDK